MQLTGQISKIVIFLFVFVLTIFLVVVLFFNYKSLTSMIKTQSEKLDRLTLENIELKKDLSETQRKFDIYKADLAETSWPAMSENLSQNLTGFISELIPENTFATSTTITYKDQEAKHVTINFPEIDEERRYNITFSEFIYNKPPLFTIQIDQSLTNNHAAKIVPFVIDPKEYQFTSKDQFKVYKRTTFNHMQYMFTFTPISDNKPRLVQIGYDFPTSYTKENEEIAQKKVFEIINSIKLNR